MINFSELGIQEGVIKMLKENGIVSPTPVQEKTIPKILKGKDLIAQAQTGTGKTLAFILPIIEKIDPADRRVQSLVIAPTRELALQITSEVKKLVKDMDEVNVLAVYGGQDVGKQMKHLTRGSQIVIGTPGRLLDHLHRETLDLSAVSMLVLDEADEMLNMGFLSDVEEIISQTPSSRQTMLFSATIPSELSSLAARYMNKPEKIHVKSLNITLEEIEQYVVETSDRHKQAALRVLLDTYRPFLAIIFCRTKIRAKTLNDALRGFGYNSNELHGDLSQGKREKIMKSFREMKLQFLIATDVAARGLDVEGVTHVFNYDIPHDVESYIHRIGRTGRAGDRGIAITLTAPKDRSHLELIEKGINQKITRKEVSLPENSAVSNGKSKTENDSTVYKRGRPVNNNAKRSGNTRKSPGRR